MNERTNKQMKIEEGLRAQLSGEHLQGGGEGLGSVPRTMKQQWCAFQWNGS